jgi:hypothetical protein
LKLGQARLAARANFLKKKKEAAEEEEKRRDREADAARASADPVKTVLAEVQTQAARMREEILRRREELGKSKACTGSGSLTSSEDQVWEVSDPAGEEAFRAPISPGASGPTGNSGSARPSFSSDGGNFEPPKAPPTVAIDDVVFSGPNKAETGVDGAHEPVR